MYNKIKVRVDGKKAVLRGDLPLIVALNEGSFEIPDLCHRGVSKIGSCGLCVVQIDGELVKSCQAYVVHDMHIMTSSKRVLSARKGLNTLLNNEHINDCLLCHKSNFCDIQNSLINYGSLEMESTARWTHKPELDLGKNITTQMAKCTLCGACTEFMREVAAMPILAQMNRGKAQHVMKLDIDLGHSPLTGNLIDICPAGAIQNKSFVKSAIREWQIKRFRCIDVLDSFGSSLDVSVSNASIVNISIARSSETALPWITDKARFSYDALQSSRIEAFHIKNAKTMQLEEVPKSKAIGQIYELLIATPPHKCAFVIGDMVDCESIFLLREIASHLGVTNLECRQDGDNHIVGHRPYYSFSTPIHDLQNSDLCLLIGTNPALDCPLLNAILYQQSKRGNYSTFAIGLSSQDLGYPYTNLGGSPQAIVDIMNGDSFLCEQLRQATRPIMIIGSGVLSRPDYQSLLSMLSSISLEYGLVTKDFNGFNILTRDASRVGAMDLGFYSQIGKNIIEEIVLNNSDIDLLLLLGSDSLDMSRIRAKTVIYQGHHQDKAMSRANIVMPCTVSFEQHGTYVNFTGKPQLSLGCIQSHSQVPTRYDSLLEISHLLGLNLNLKNFWDIRRAMIDKYPLFNPHLAHRPAKFEPILNTSGSIDVSKQIVASDFSYYSRDVICRNSKMITALIKT